MSGVYWVSSLSLFPVDSRSGLDVDKVFGSRGVSNPSPASLEDFIFCWLLLGPFPEFSVADGLGPSDPKDSSKAGVDECLDLLQCRGGGSPCFSSIQQDRFHWGVKDLDPNNQGHTSDLQIVFLEATLPSVWRYKVGVRTGWLGVCIL